MYFQTGEIARMNGTTLRTVRLCESYGIISPAREKNGYRYYTLKESFQIADFLAFRGMGFSVEESKWLMQHGMSADALPMVRAKLEEINGKMSELEAQQRKLKAVSEELTFAFQNEGVILRADLPARIFLPIIVGQELSCTEDFEAICRKWMQALPITNHTLLFDTTAPAEDGNFYSTMGLSVEAAELERLGLPDHEAFLHIPRKNCLTMYRRVQENGNRLDYQVLRELQAYLLGHGLDVDGPLLARPLFAEKQENGQFSLFRYVLPVREKGTAGQ